MTDPSVLADEIAEQPAALRRLLRGETATMRSLAERIGADVTAVMLAGRGTSDNAARYAQYVLGGHNRLAVALATPSLFTRYHTPPRLDGMLIGAVSQSGRSPDVVGVVAEGNRQGRPTFALTNTPDSPLGREARTVIALHAGEERSVAATKTYTTSLAALAMLSTALDDADGRAAHLAALPDAVEHAVTTALRAVRIPDWLADAPACAVIGRGFNYATAFEIALKLKELTSLAAAPYSAADFLHGPIAAVTPQMPVLLVAPSGVVFPDVAELAGELRSRGARLVVISDVANVLAVADLALPLPEGVSEWLSPVTAVVPGQVLAWRLAEARGLDVDRPPGLRKVTETR